MKTRLSPNVMCDEESGLLHYCGRSLTSYSSCFAAVQDLAAEVRRLQNKLDDVTGGAFSETLDEEEEDE